MKYTALFNYINYIELTLEDAEAISHSGSYDQEVAELMDVPYVKAQMDAINPQSLISELNEYGTWDDNELSGHDQNLHRILWLAGGDITNRVIK